MIRILPLIITLVLLVNGCTHKPWQDPLGEDEEKSLREELSVWQQRQCPQFINAELSVKWDSKLKNGSLTGYLQLLLPSATKVIAVNPLGQPLFALATEGQRFQAINVMKGIYRHGRTAHFLERYNLPRETLQGNWAQWLSGNARFTDAELTETRYDAEKRGIWLTVIKQDARKKEKELLLYHPTLQKILSRIIIDQNGHMVISIDYDNWSKTTPCPLPQHVTVEGKSLGTDIDIQLSDILTEESYPKEKFTLKMPPHYLRQYYP